MKTVHTAIINDIDEHRRQLILEAGIDDLPIYAVMIATVAEYHRARNGILNLNESVPKETVRRATERMHKATRELNNLAQACITIEDRKD